MPYRRISQFQPKRKRSIALVFVFAFVLFGSVGFGMFATMRSERALTVIDPASLQVDDEEYDEDYEVLSVDTRSFDPAGELSIDEKERYDAQRRDDIQQIHGALQGYYSEYGHYPRLGNLNSGQFRSTQFPELDTSVFQDPEDNESRVSLTRTPQKQVYAYDVLNDEGYTCEPVGRECTNYILVATLSGGLLFSINHND